MTLKEITGQIKYSSSIPDDLKDYLMYVLLKFQDTTQISIVFEVMYL